MSLHSLKQELDARSGRDLLPSYFPMSVLVSFCRELAIHGDGRHSYDEHIAMNAIMKSYLTRISGMRGGTWRHQFESNTEKLTPLLTEELYRFICEQIVSKLIGIDVQFDFFLNRFGEIIDSEPEVEIAE